MSAAATTAVTALPATRPIKTDFADWLSPILVKELRQGLKTKSFVLVFLLIQVVMVILVALQVTTVSFTGPDAGRGPFNEFFWFFVTLPVLFIMPGRGLGAISEETKANTLDLVQLTHLSSFRIVFGKWVALAAQTAMVVTAILPYAVLRYFFGAVDLVDDLVAICMLMLASFVLTAGTISLSTAHPILRVIMLLLGSGFVLSTGGGLMAMRFGGGGGFIYGAVTSVPTWVWLYVVGVAGVYIYFLLELAASKIAPLSENHSARKRGLALLLASGVCLASFVVDRNSVPGLFVPFIPLWAWTMVESLTEKTTLVPSLYGRFLRFGKFGSVLGRLLYPGWATGLLFTAICYVLLSVTVWYSTRAVPHSINEFQSHVFFVIFFTALVTPVLVLLIFPGAKQSMMLYVLTQALFGLLYVMASIIGSAPAISREAAYEWLAPFPTSALLALMDRGFNGGLAESYTTFGYVAYTLILGYLAYRAAREFRIIGVLERRAKQEDEPA